MRRTEVWQGMRRDRHQHGAAPETGMRKAGAASHCSGSLLVEEGLRLSRTSAMDGADSTVLALSLQTGICRHLYKSNARSPIINS